LNIQLLVLPLFSTSSQVLYFEDDYLEVELAIHIYVDKWPMTNKPPSLSQTPRGPMLVGDPVGMSLAVEMLYHSVIGKGRNAPHIQFDTMRKSRSTFTRSWDSSPLGVIEGSTFTKGLTRARTTSCPTQSNWFSYFLIGSEDRMGYDTKRQEALPISKQ
jgi:hypothetical protein